MKTPIDHLDLRPLMRAARFVILGLCAAFLQATALAQTQPAQVYNVYSSGSTGADGEFNPRLVNQDGEVRLVGAPPGSTWKSGDWPYYTFVTNLVVRLNESGVYNFTSITVPSGWVVTFIPNAANTPVVWLASGDVRINGRIDVSARATTCSVDNRFGGETVYDSNVHSYRIPGPGGFPGGRPFESGQGPLGSMWQDEPDGNYTRTLGGAGIPSLPPVGGSGQGGLRSWAYNSDLSKRTVRAEEGAAGGGVIYIAASGSVTGNSSSPGFALGGPDTDNGYKGSSGVAVVLANSVRDCRVATGIVGTTRDQLLVAAFHTSGLSTKHVIYPPTPVGIYPGPAPLARIASIGNYTISKAAAVSGGSIARIPAGGQQTVVIETSNLPPGIQFNVTFASGTNRTVVPFPATVGTQDLARTSGSYDFTTGMTTISAIASAPIQLSMAPVWEGEPLNELQIALDPKGHAQAHFVTSQGSSVSYEAGLWLASHQGKTDFLHWLSSPSRGASQN